MGRTPLPSILSAICYALLGLIPTTATATLIVTTEVGPTWPTGKSVGGGRVGQSSDPLGAFSNIPVIFLGSTNGGGTETLLNTSLRFRFRLDYTEPMRLDSILISSQGDDRASSQIRLLDQNRSLLASQPLSGLVNVYSPATLNAGNAQGQSFFFELWDTSTTYRYVDRIEIHASAVTEPASLVLCGAVLATAMGWWAARRRNRAAWIGVMAIRRAVAVWRPVAIFAALLIAPCHQANAQTTLFFDDFNGPTLNSIYQASLPGAPLASGGVGSTSFGTNPLTYLGSPSYSFGTVDGATVLRLTNTMNNRQRYGWNTNATFNASDFRLEIRFNSLVQSPATSIDSFIEGWLIDANNRGRFLLAGPSGQNYGTLRQFRDGSSIDGSTLTQSFPWFDNTWYKLVVTGGSSQNIRASIFADNGTTELVGQTFNFNGSTFPSGFEIGLSHATGVPNGHYPVDVAIDYVRLTTSSVPEPTSFALCGAGLATAIGSWIARRRTRKMQIGQPGRRGAKAICRWSFIVAALVIASCEPVAAQTTLFFDDFNGPTLNSVYQASLPNRGENGLPSNAYLGAPNYSFGTLGGATIIRLTNTMNNRQSRGWSISTTFNVDQFRFEARFNTLNQGPSISIDNFIEAWLIDPTTPTRALTAAADDGSASINRQMRTWNGIESAYRIQPFSFLDNRWYRLVLAGGLNQNIRAALVADDAVTELVSRTFAFSTSIFPNGFSIGLGQSTGVPNKDSPLDVAIDYVRLTTVPEPPSSVVVLAAVVLGGRILFARRCKHANTTADHTANIKKQTTSILSPEP